MDYDLTTIPDTYDCGHDHGPAVLEQWMEEIASHLDSAQVHDIVDLACGTGRFAPSLAERFAATVIGIDPSLKMLRQAQRKCVTNGRVVLAAGCGETLPLRSQSVDLIFISMVFHHFDDPTLVARECERVLRAGGGACLRTITRDQIPNYPYLEFFPGSRPLLEQRLPTLAATCAAFEAATLRRRFSGIVVQQIAPDYATYADKLAAGADTTLTSLAPAEFAAGLASMRATHATSGRTSPIVEPIDFIVFQKVEEMA